MAHLDKQEPIAIIGAACRLPGEVSSLGNLWDMVSQAKTGHCKIPSERWNADVWYHPDEDRRGGISLKHGYSLQQDVGHFDAPFFSTTAKEAAAMDPMKRLLLEVAYESIESANSIASAGIPVNSLINSQTGCYVGCMTNDYEVLSLHDIYDLGHTAASATSEAMTANRVSWFFGLQGPSLTLDTACSSSLYALHLACQSLKLGETNMASSSTSLVAGVNLILNPNTMHQLSAMHTLSPEGVSHTFDDRANGYGRGEGIGCLVVKRLSDALRDGDTIRAVIRGTSVNADGKTPSITQPSSTAQADLIKKTYEAAGLPQTETQYFESHGTGTPVGDPIELEAIAFTLGASRAAAGLGPLYVGSIKPNVGHTEGCSGLAGVLKAVTCLEQGMLVPTYGVENINPRLRLNDWNIALPPQLMKWPVRGQRRISVNSFGFGGANAHAILDDAHYYLAHRGLVGNHNTVVHDDDDSSESGISVGTNTPPTEDDHTQRLFVFSTKDQAGNQRMAGVYANALDSPGLNKFDTRYLSNLAYTLASRRSPLEFRSYAVASSKTELSAQLLKGLPKLARSSRQESNLVFIFTGQGAQWPGMGRQLVKNAVFLESIQTSQRYLDALGCEWSALKELEKTEGSLISLPEYSQTLCTVLQLALIDLLQSWSISPGATVGHSSGEIAAAYAASMLTHADAIKVAFFRGLCSAAVTREGAMMAAGVSEHEASDYLAHVTEGTAVVACINSPSSVTLSGNVEAIDKLEALISGAGKFARKLKVETAYHSQHMAEVVQDYFHGVGELSHSIAGTSRTLMFSSLKGRLIESAQELDAEYWVSNMQSPVQFSAAVSSLLNHPAQPGKKAPVRWGAFVELGPHTALQGPVQQIITSIGANKAAKDAPYLGMVLRNKDAVTTALEGAGQLWATGYPVNLTAANGSESSVTGPKALTNLPPYPWNHGKRFWHESYLMRSNRSPAAPRTDLLGVPEDMQNKAEPRWRNHLRITENPWVEDHKITGTVLYPAAGMLVMALEGAFQTVTEPATRAKVSGFRFRDVSFDRGLVVTTGDDAAVETRLSLLPHPTATGQFKFTVYSTTNGTSWTKHCYGSIALEYTIDTSHVEDAVALGAEWERHTILYKKIQDDSTAEIVHVDGFYEHLERIGMDYGPLFRNVVSLTTVPRLHAAHAHVVLPDTASSMPAGFEFPHVMHPATMDSIFHLLLAALNDGRPVVEAAVPYRIADMFVSAHQPHGAGKRFRGYGQLVHKSRSGHELIGDMVVSDEAWSGPKLTITGFALRQVTAAESADGVAVNSVDANLRKCAQLQWKEDVDFIKTRVDLIRLQGADTLLSIWVDRLAHKKAVENVLLVLNNRACSVTASALGTLIARLGKRPGIHNIVVAAPSSNVLDTCRPLLSAPELDTLKWDWTSGEESPDAIISAYDVVILIADNQTAGILAEPGPLAHLRKLLLSHGHLVVLQEDDDDEQINTVAILQAVGLADSIVAPGIVIASAPHSTPVARPSEVYLLLPVEPLPETLGLAATLTTVLYASETVVHNITLSAASELAGKHVISLLESSTPFIYSWTADDFDSFKTIISTAAHVFWLTRGDLLNAWGTDVAGTAFAPAQGLLRVMRNEYPLVKLPHLDLSKRLGITSPAAAQLVFDVWAASLMSSAENEFAESEGAIYIPRAIGNHIYDGELQLASGQAKPIRMLLGHNKTPLVPNEVVGGDLLWVDDDTATEPLGPREVEVEVSYVALGTFHIEEDLSGLGRDAVGIVTRRGSQVMSHVEGQQVAVFRSQGAFKTHVRQEETLVAVLPSDVVPEQVAAIPSLFVSAQYALLEIAKLQRGQTILVHCAATPLGQAIMQVSGIVGADVFALVGSKAEKQLLVERYGITPGHVFDSSLRTFVTGIAQITNGRGVDVVLSSLSSPAVLPSMDVLGDFGHFVDLGQKNQDVSLPLSKRNASLVRIDMNRVYQAKQAVITCLFQRTFQWLTRGSIKLIVPASFTSLTETQQALSIVTNPKYQAGTTILSLADPSASILMSPSPAPELALDSEGTYILAGGLGALGLDIAGMMASHGAGHLVFLSRSGNSSKHTPALNALRALGTRAEAFTCDVTKANNIAAVFTELQQRGCKIRGVLQAAMVLEDGIFDNMTHDKWLRAFMPKTRGSRNLLSQLASYDSFQDDPAKKPFFILLSSITGVIGNTAQANYASGNTFGDALAHYAHTHLDIPATSIDVGLVSDSSHFTKSGEFGDLKGYLNRYSHGWNGLQTNLEELRVLLSALMRRAHDGQTVPAQLVLGLGDGLVRRAGGVGFEHDAKFELRVKRDDGDASGEADRSGKGASVSAKLAQSSSLVEATAVVEEDLKAQVAAAIGVAVLEVDAQRPLFDFGVDSLKAVELRNRALRELQSDVSVFDILSATPLVDLATKIAAKSKLVILDERDSI
ncbi:ketoacyl-synt-domain-containing protein [Dothidotthia symphoricarpi CBS 119687]|uniref:Ketoacyl-synt-domain-containing protein n=1 Tax=Dothidotthia symphoricarpi CBS 119687 TaxID=1392245 RepID=A0A6A6AF29_9PLEO|nr:ketoacyl-synt-domain-containing protein [Dothidotthia symphoricarpi CBS 119687]KAF2129725.1 ketoacyl-synt-domain-containing protein [Dothidotthia symphoricarpi CBS 119687]